MIKHRLFLQWWFVFTLLILGGMVTAGLGGIQLIYQHDVSMLSFLILAILGGMSLCCGAITFLVSRSASQGEKIQGAEYKRLLTWEEAGWFASDICLTLGMIGTVVGFILMLVGGFEKIDASNVESMQKSLGQMATGMSTALYTTLVGLIASTVLKLQYFNLSQGLSHFREDEDLKIGMEE